MLEGDENTPIPEGIDPVAGQLRVRRVPGVRPRRERHVRVTFEEGHTYAAVCFIPDREGGLPHAIQHGMYDVFQVGPASLSDP